MQQDGQSLRAWPRRALVSAWLAAFAVGAAALASIWEPVVARLAEAPSPATLPPPVESSLPTPSPGERAVGEARALARAGDLAGALAVLDRIPPDDPAYPFARRLRAEGVQVLIRGSRP